MAILQDLISGGTLCPDHRPWPRATVGAAQWEAACEALVDGRCTLLGLWGERTAVHMALLGEGGAIAVLSHDCPEGRFPSVGRRHAPARRLERTIADLFGLTAEGAPDDRAWLDHGRWGLREPLGRAQPSETGGDPYEYLPVEGDGLHRISVGPVHAGTIEPGHFRFTVNGEAVARLEARFGYAHKGIEGLMAGADIARAAQLAARVSGDATVAYGIAFARAVEAALEVEAPARAHWLRALMAELERLANHLGDFGAICNDASFALMHAHCGILRERVLRASAACFGHRLMRDIAVPGGVAGDLDGEGVVAVRDLLAGIRARLPGLIELYDNTASLQDRTIGTGLLDPVLARRFGAGGPVGRASGRAFDCRRTPGYPPYDTLRFEVPVRQECDVNARVWVRIDEIGQSLSLVEQILAGMPDGSLRTELPTRAGEGMALAESFRGDVLVWIRLDGAGRVARCHLRDPSWFQWPLIEAVVEGNIVADFPLCNKSFNCSYSGHDL
ncbi:MAG: nickel-dependent hydrogenase large subunit [Proteobacteria bacterium]|nr:nickel-dependent hydrogenase large subunit [Pseudomonadota bacterium]